MHQRLTGLNPLPTHATIYQRVEVKSLLTTDIGTTPNPLSFRKKAPTSTSTRSSQFSTGGGRSRSVNTIIPYTQDWGNADAISPQNLFLTNPTSVSTVARMPTSSRRSRRGEVDSSDDDESNARTRATRRRPGKPFVPPVTKSMPGGCRSLHNNSWRHKTSTYLRRSHSYDYGGVQTET